MPKALQAHDLKSALAKLTSLHDGDIGVVEAVACGESAVPALRDILFSRSPSGLYETRRRAVEALAGLHALDVLRDYLAAPHDIEDPVERTGEDAVMNAAARALGKAADTRDIPLLAFALRKRPLAGVIEALGKFRQIKMLACFIEALGDDFTREAAEDAIRKLGARAVPALLDAARHPRPADARESGGSIARRRSALRLLGDLPPGAGGLPAVFAQLLQDADPWIAFHAARLTLANLNDAEKRQAVARLVTLLKTADEVLSENIADCFVEHYDLARGALEAAVARIPENAAPVWRSSDHTRQVYERVQRRVAAACAPGGIRHA